MFRNVPECSGMFRNVPCSGFYRRPFKTALKVELFSYFDKGPITRARKKILAVKMNKQFGTVIWLGNLEWCICILKRKSGFLRQVFVFYSVANVGDFCSFKGYADRPEIQKFIKKIFCIFRLTKCKFVTTQVAALISQDIREINFSIRNQWSVLTETRS